MSSEFSSDPEAREAVRARATEHARHLAQLGYQARHRQLVDALPHALGETAEFDEVGVALAYHSLLTVASLPVADNDQTALGRGRRYLAEVCEQVRERATTIGRAGRPTFPRHEDDHDGRGYARELRDGRGTDGGGR